MKPEEAAKIILRKLSKNPNLKEAKRRNLFTSHLLALFPDYAWQISEYAVGAEEPVKIKSKSGEKTVTGRIDTRKGALLIEYKTDLTSTREKEKAERQLEEYVAGIVNKEGLESINNCLATDILRWREYDLEVEIDPNEYEVQPEDVNLVFLRDYDFSNEDITQFLNITKRIIFEDVPIVATGKLLSEFFGLHSECYEEFSSKLREIWLKKRDDSTAQLGLTLWSDYIENCFDKGADVNEDTYLDHVYLVILARMIAGSAIGKTTEQAQERFPERCITGQFFSSGTHRVERFVEEDFFRWIKDDKVIKNLKPVLNKLHNDLQRLDFISAKKLDLFQVLYQDIMPPRHRVEYGAVFTPSWLVKHIVSEFESINKIGKKVLDPACGTGSFLRAVIEKKLEVVPDHWSSQRVLDNILQDITGLDINPISVIIAKTTIMLILADHLKESDEPVDIPIYLCDSLFLPDELIHKSKDELVVRFDGSKIKFPAKLFAKGPSTFSELVQVSENLANQIVENSIHSSDSKEILKSKINKIIDEKDWDYSDKKALQKSCEHLIDELVQRIVDDWNRVWAFVLENTYRPSFLEAKFDYVVSNPPWLAMSSFPNATYKERLEIIIDNYNLTPFGSSKHHMEISTLFAVHCVNHYMGEDGNFAFILPRVILNGDQHDPFRRSKFEEKSPMNISYLWDLEKVDHLFKRPACTIFGNHDKGDAGFPEKLPQKIFSGNPESLCIKEKPSLTLKTFGSKSAFSEEAEEEFTAVSYYDNLFRQGADLMPRCAVMVDIVSKIEANVLSIQTSTIEKNNPYNKPPYSELDFKGTIERDYIFTTLKSNSVLPFVNGPFSYTALPLEVHDDEFKILSTRDIVLKGDDRALRWFEQVNKKLLDVSDNKLEKWLKRKNKLVDQTAEGCEYTVLYGAGGKNVTATIVDTTETDFPFINDQTLYAWKAQDMNEAFYVCGMLNSRPVNEAIKSLQAKGDFGQQHVHKLPLYLIPKFNDKNPEHMKVVEESIRLSIIGEGICRKNSECMDLNKSLHSRRKKYKKEIESEMKEINEISNNIIPTEEVK